MFEIKPAIRFFLNVLADQTKSNSHHTYLRLLSIAASSYSPLLTHQIQNIAYFWVLVLFLHLILLNYVRGIEWSDGQDTISIPSWKRFSIWCLLYWYHFTLRFLLIYWLGFYFLLLKNNLGADELFKSV